MTWCWTVVPHSSWPSVDLAKSVDLSRLNISRLDSRRNREGMDEQRRQAILEFKRDQDIDANQVAGLSYFMMLWAEMSIAWTHSFSNRGQDWSGIPQGPRSVSLHFQGWPSQMECNSLYFINASLMNQTMLIELMDRIWVLGKRDESMPGHWALRCIEHSDNLFKNDECIFPILFMIQMNSVHWF